MSENIEENQITFEKLLESAQRGDWDFVDSHIDDSHLTKERIDWALSTGAFDENDNVRDLAMILLDRSDLDLSPIRIELLKKIMVEDSYNIVRYRAAIALYKRGFATSEITNTMKEAKNNPDVGELARSIRPQK